MSLLNFGQNYFVQLGWNWFSVQLPFNNAWNCHLLYTTFSSNVGAWGMWACSLFLSFIRFIYTNCDHLYMYELISKNKHAVYVYTVSWKVSCKCESLVRVNPIKRYKQLINLFKGLISIEHKIHLYSILKFWNTLNAVTLLKYCGYGVKHNPINQSWNTLKSEVTNLRSDFLL